MKDDTAHKKGSVSVAVLVCILTASTILALHTTDLQGLFFKGNELFHQANEVAPKDPDGAGELYGKALMRFKRIVEEGGVHNGRLYYNIGNIYFRTGDIGRAILSYRRARQYIPNDPNLIQNLRYARSRCIDRIEEAQRTRILKTLLFWHYDLSARTRSVIFAVCFILFWTIAAVRLLRQRTVPRWVLVALGFGAVIFLGSLLTEAWIHSRENVGVVLADEVNARKGDSASYQPSFKDPLHAGAEFRVVEDRGDWLHVRLLDGRSCWVPRKDIGLVR